MNIHLLSEYFEPEKISWRIGATNQKKIALETNNPKAKPTKGIALAYIDARDVMDRLDEVCGPENWQSKYEHASSQGYVCSIGIRVDGEWIWKANGAGETQVEAQKGASSDSFKRAATLWGIGRYLYDVESPWVRINEYGDIDPNDKKKLIALLPNAPKQAANNSVPQSTPFDDEPAQQEADDIRKQCADIIETIEAITALERLLGYTKTPMVKRFYNLAPESVKAEISSAIAKRKTQLEANKEAA